MVEYYSIFGPNALPTIRLRYQSFGIRVDNESQIGTPLRQNLPGTKPVLSLSCSYLEEVVSGPLFEEQEVEFWIVQDLFNTFVLRVLE